VQVIDAFGLFPFCASFVHEPQYPHTVTNYITATIFTDVTATAYLTLATTVFDGTTYTTTTETTTETDTTTVTTDTSKLRRSFSSGIC